MTDMTNTGFGHPIQALADGLTKRAKQFHQRRGFKRLLDLDDVLLDDMGVTRGEVEIASKKPLSVDAATELMRMSLERRKMGM